MKNKSKISDTIDDVIFYISDKIGLLYDNNKVFRYIVLMFKRLFDIVKWPLYGLLIVAFAIFIVIIGAISTLLGAVYELILAVLWIPTYVFFGYNLFNINNLFFIFISKIFD